MMARRRRVRSRRYQCSATKPSSQAVASRAAKRQDKVSSKHKQEKHNMEFVDNMSKGNTKKRRGENDDTTDEQECVLPKPKHAKYSRHSENVFDYSSRTVKVAQSRRRPGQKRRKTHNRKSEEKDSNEANVMKVTWFMKETEKCIEVECGRNKALLILSKLNSGSNGRCVYFKDSWLTPNEFQNVSGRQMAKDWKRSIKHNGHCLKLLLLGNLIQPSSIQILEPSQPEQVASIQCLPDTEQKVDKEADSNTSNILLSEPIIDGAGEPEDDLETAQSHTLEVGIPNSNESDESDGDMEVDSGVTVGTIATLSDDSRDWANTEKIHNEANETPVEHLDVLSPEDLGKDTSAETNTDEIPKTEIKLDTEVEEKSITDTDSHTGRVIPDLSSGNETSKKSDNAIVPTPQPYIQNHFINIFPSAVTPPPTPPNDNLKEIITDQNVGIPNVQLNSKAQHELDQTADQKLGEQRSQNKYYQEYCELEQNRYIKGTELSNSENNQVNLEAHEMPLEDNANEKQLQTTLLKDALQCAKRYKEKFQSDRSTKQLCIKTEDTTMKLGQLHEQKSGTHLHHNTNYRPEDKSCKSAWSLEITGTRYSDSNFKRQEDRVEADNDTSSYQSSWESIEQHSRIMSQLAAMQRYYSDLGWLNRFTYPQPFQYIYPSPTVVPGVAEIQRFMAMYYTPGNLYRGTDYRHNVNDLLSIPCPPVPNYDSTQISSHHSKYYGSPMDCIPMKDPTYVKNECALDLSSKVCRHERKYDKAGSNNGISMNTTGKTSCDNKYTNSKSGKVCANSYHNAPIDFSCSKDVNQICDSLCGDKGRLRQKAKHKPMYDSISQNGLKDMKYWSVDDVGFFLASVDGCAKYSDVFKSHGITGRILPYLTSQHLTRTLGMKLTSAMNLLQEIDRITTLSSAQMIPHMMNQETLSKIIK